jgi:hypothetical protein
MQEQYTKGKVKERYGKIVLTGLSSYYNGADIYKQVACLDKVLGFAQSGLVRDAGGFHGGIFECSQIQWSGSIYD